MGIDILAPIIRGVLIELGHRPLILLSSPEQPADLPVLKLNAPGLTDSTASPPQGDEIRLAEKALADQCRCQLNNLRGRDGSLPAAVRIPGTGSFYAGVDWQAAQEARTGRIKCFCPTPLAGREDVVRGRIALVTGGAQGFGEQIARGLARHGAFVIIADIDFNGARKLADELNAKGRCAYPLETDVSSPESVRHMIRCIVREVGGLDILVSNAGVLKAGSVLELSVEDFELVTKINYEAFFLMVKECAPLMIRQWAGAPGWKTDVLQINSKSGLEGSHKNGAYAGGKFGGIGLVQSFALELIEYGIKVNAVCPGNFFDGPLWSHPKRGLFVQYLWAGKVPGAKNMADVKAFYEAKVPMGRGCSGDDVLKAILYCVEQEYETGQAVPVTGGQIMLK